MKKLAEVLKDWEAVIGLEVHTELTTLETKMFCNCRLSHDDEPNTNVCPVCLGMPGALPVPNEKAIESIVMAGLATNCEIMRHSMFYRKHYFYPDMAKNFQTTQGPVAFCMHGRLDLEVSGAGAKERPDSTVEKDADGGYVAPIRILRIHMEEDAAKMVHVGGEEGRITAATESLIDYNRCGTPPHRARHRARPAHTRGGAPLHGEAAPDVPHARHLRLLARERLDALRRQHFLRRRGETKFGTKTEMKNINSFKSLHGRARIRDLRQAEVLEEGGIVYQETRHWEPSRRRTVVMRVKETADDYRLFPDPDLAPFDLTDEFVERCRARIPELPDAKRDRYMASYGIKRADAAQLAGDPTVAAFFEETLSAAGEKNVETVAKVMVNLVPSYDALSPAQVASLSALLAEDAITFAQAREVLDAVNGTEEDPAAYVDAHGMRQSTGRGPRSALSSTRCSAAAPTRSSSIAMATRRCSGSSWASA